MSSIYHLFCRNGKIDSTPSLKVKKLVLFNRKRYERVRAIAGSQRRKREASFKNLSAKNKKVLTADKPAEASYGYYAPKYTKQSQVWSWMRVSEWFEDLENYYGVAR